MTRQLLLCAALLLPTPHLLLPALPAIAYELDDQPVMDELGIKLLRYKTQRLRIEARDDGFEIIEGISHTLSHKQLLQRVGQLERLKALEEQKNRAHLFTSIGYGLGAVGVGFLTKYAVAQDNFSLWIGLGGLAAGLGLSVAFESLTPGEETPLLTVEEAQTIVEVFNKQLKKQLGLPEEMP